MKNFNKVWIVVSIVVFVFGLCLVNNTFAATSPTLTGSINYSILGASTVTNTGTTTIGGDVGVSPGTSITGFPPGVVGGTIHSNDADAIAAQSDDVTTFGTLDQLCDHTYADGQDLTLLSPLVPGVYCSLGSFAISGNLTLSGSGVWIFKSATTLVTASHSTVTGGDPCNVWWRVGSSATLGTSSSLIGNIFSDVSITFNTSATLNGRALAQTGAVTLDTNNISVPVCGVLPTATLTLTNSVTNDNGGARTVSDFPLTATGPTTITGISGISGVANETVSTGVYTLSETTHSDYTPGAWSCTNGITVNGSNQITLASGDVTTCTVINDDIAPSLTLNKFVIGGTALPTAWTLTANGAGILPTNLTGTNPVISGATFKADTYTLAESGGPSNYTPTSWVCSGATITGNSITLAPGDVAVCNITNTYVPPLVVHSGGGGGFYTPPVPPLIDVIKVPSPLALPSGPGLVTYAYTLKNVGTVPVSNITMIDNSCSPLKYVSGDTNSDSKLDLTETWTYTCATNLEKTTTNTVVATGLANGISATSIANATVVVGASVVPPLIHVTKIPSPLALLSGAGMVTYTEKITNPGAVPLTNVHISDDKCSPLKYISGDLNKDSKLDTTETWIYTCQTRLTKTTINTATVSGEANGITAKDFAIATVVVSTPGLPKTGFPPKTENIPWVTIILGMVALVSSALILKSAQSSLK